MRALYKTLTHSRILERDIKLSLKGYQRFIGELIKEHGIEILEMPDYQEYINYIRTPVYFPQWDIPTVVMHGSMTYFRKEAGESVPDFIFLPERRIIKHATAIASVSEYTARKTALYFDIEKDIKVLYNGIEPRVEQLAIDKRSAQVIFSGSLLLRREFTNWQRHGI